VLPSDLGLAEKELRRTEAEFRRLREARGWEAVRPSWTKEEFKPHKVPNRTEAYEPLDAEDVLSILLPNRTAWRDVELRIVTQGCRYPHQAPVEILRELREFPSTTLRLEPATLEYDKLRVSERQIARYFWEERENVGKYNQLRSELMIQCATLRQQIEEWSEHSRLEWKTYARQSKLLVEEELSKFRSVSELYAGKCQEQKSSFAAILAGYKDGQRNDVINRTNYVLSNLSLPASVPRTWDVDFDEDQQILIVEVALPDVVHNQAFKRVPQKKGLVAKPLSQTERREIIPKVHPAILLRVAHEVFREDDAHIVRLLVLNGWVKFDDPRTGINTKAYTASLMVERDQIFNLNLERVDPLAAFESLHGKSAGKLVELIPIEPTLSLNKKDSRFVDAKAVLSTLGSATNLAAMDWQDFEHLIRELFEKEFAGRGAEVKITQASRDRGVDAIVFDPDPIHGGKYVIQAKRYTNTVDVSAVRDLCAVVKKEGASRGILVTTSAYGADAYAFANNEPVTLLNGAELLGLLRRHGYGFRINLQEARQLQTNLRRS